MLTKIRNRMAQEEGFTLIELLVVILIIGILAAVAIPTFLSQKNKATDSNAQSNLKNAQLVVESYANGNNGTYAGTGNTPQVLNTVNGMSQGNDVGTLSSGSQKVYYNSTAAAATGSTSDTYTLCAQGSQNATPHYFWISVNAGATTYDASTTMSCTSTYTATGAANANAFPALTTT